jgi:hypothetical protein
MRDLLSVFSGCAGQAAAVALKAMRLAGKLAWKLVNSELVEKVFDFRQAFAANHGMVILDFQKDSFRAVNPGDDFISDFVQGERSVEPAHNRKYDQCPEVFDSGNPLIY